MVVGRAARRVVQWDLQRVAHLVVVTVEMWAVKRVAWLESRWVAWTGPRKEKQGVVDWVGHWVQQCSDV